MKKLFILSIATIVVASGILISCKKQTESTKIEQVKTYTILTDDFIQSIGGVEKLTTLSGDELTSKMDAAKLEKLTKSEFDSKIADLRGTKNVQNRATCSSYCKVIGSWTSSCGSCGGYSNGKYWRGKSTGQLIEERSTSCVVIRYSQSWCSGC